MSSKRKAFTLTELIIVVLMLGALSAVAIPRMSLGLSSKYNARSTARKLAGSLRKTRQLAIAGAASNSSGFRLTMSGSAPYSGYQITNLNTSSVVQTESIDSSVSCTGSSVFTFGPLGNRLTNTGGLTISASGKQYVITVVSATGMIKCVEN